MLPDLVVLVQIRLEGPMFRRVQTSANVHRTQVVKPVLVVVSLTLWLLTGRFCPLGDRVVRSWLTRQIKHLINHKFKS